jgi:ATP-dependent protease HslVU (ClpYQ) peptidase subunit
MTTIIADAKSKIMISDTSANGGYGTFASKKVFKDDNVAVGIAGDAIIGKRLAEFILSSDYLDEEDLLNLKESAAFDEDKGNDSEALILTSDGRIFFMENEYFEKIEVFDDYFAIGSGAKFARGAMHAASLYNDDPVAVIKTALQVAAKLDPFTGSEFKIFHF